jgi:hypothetical protein
MCNEYYIFSMISSVEGFQNIPIMLIVSTILLLVGSSLLVIQVVTADQSSQGRSNNGYNDGFKNAECDLKHCHGHGIDRMAPSGHTNAYDNGYSKGYHDGWNKASGSGGRSNQQSTPNGTSSIDGVPNGQQVPNNNSAVCDPTYQFCAMTIPIS